MSELFGICFRVVNWSKRGIVGELSGNRRGMSGNRRGFRDGFRLRIVNCRGIVGEFSGNCREIVGLGHDRKRATEKYAYATRRSSRNLADATLLVAIPYPKPLTETTRR